MDTLALKLLVTPMLILAASLASRRWGEAIGGWFVGLPLTSGPVCFFLALDQGTGFAAASCLGSLAGVVAEAAFCTAYGQVSRRSGWLPALAVASVAFFAGFAVLSWAALSLWPVILVAWVALGLSLWLMPRLAGGGTAVLVVPRWDIPARMVVATTIVLGITTLAPDLGPRLSGLVTTYPVFAAVLAVFSHQARGPAAGLQILRGLMTGLFAYTGFFAVLALGLESFGIAMSFIAATLLALLVQAGSLVVLRRAP